MRRAILPPLVLLALLPVLLDGQPTPVTGDEFYSEIYGEVHLIQNATGTTVPSFDITDCTNASPIVATTSAAHGISNGDWVVIEDVTGNTACNGFNEAASVTATTLALVGTTGNGAYIANGILGGFKVIAGTWAAGPLGNFSSDAAGVLTYTGVPASLPFVIHTSSSTPVTDIGNPICHFGVFLNGDLERDTIGARNMASTNSIGSVGGSDLIAIVNSDTLQIKVGCTEFTGAASFDVLVEHATLSVLAF